ncbi:cytochrome P450 CYP12A2-like [Musca vetustissima]|uniref:cytochrome P450 CYP12A2-like n=1 Tax=Musca vetustissima TaxID=27455 RepID=UPI002AB5EC88|nr:cytochrome P450 CYP12A2-like [Musca vetustissima]
MTKYHNYLLRNKNNYRFVVKQLNQIRSVATNPNHPLSETSPKSSFSEQWQLANPYEEIPTLGSFEMFRNFLPGGKFVNLDLTDMIMTLRSELGPICKMKGVFGRPDMVITHNPIDFETLLRNESVWPNRPGSDGLSYHRRVHRADFFQGVEGLIASQGEQWGTFRSKVNPVLLQPKNVRLYLDKISQVNKEFIKRIIEIRDPKSHEVPSNFEEELNLWSLESVSIVALDQKLGLLSENRSNPEVKKLFGLLIDFFTLSVDIEFKPPIWKYYKTKKFKKLMETLDGVTDIVSKYVEEAIERIEIAEKEGLKSDQKSEPSVLEKLIKIDKKVATVMAMDMLMAGIDTTTSAFTALLLALAKNPEKQQKLREEVMRVLPHKDSDIDEVAFRNMPYLRACIKESLRVYALAMGNARISTTDMIISGYRVPKDTLIMIVYLSLINNDGYYPRAKEYLPERWLRSPEGENALKPRSAFVNFPFGFGVRSCIGRRVVEMEMELGIARLVRNFHIEFNYSTENAFKTLLIRVPNIPLKFKFTDVEN